ncbi:MAG: oligosaccharide flippase family protein [Candidatus Competibacteraceae bacterium]|nr:oligosaccharide flippase family protein [Candidatus Competibacteraceae bacterium]
MNTTRKTIAKNASVMMLSQILTWGISLTLMMFLPRYLGPVGMGKLQLAISLWTIVGIVVSFGMDTFLTKEIARTPENINKLFSASIVLRMLLFLLGAAGMAVYTRVAGYPMIRSSLSLSSVFPTLLGSLLAAVAQR